MPAPAFLLTPDYTTNFHVQVEIISIHQSAAHDHRYETFEHLPTSQYGLEAGCCSRAQHKSRRYLTYRTFYTLCN